MCFGLCRSVGEELAAALRMFSLDLVGVVASYAVCGTATAGAKPQLLFSFGDEELRCKAITSTPDGSRVYVGSWYKIVVFDSAGQFLREILVEDVA